MEEEDDRKQAEEWQYQGMPMTKSPEIVEIGEDSKSFASSRDGGFKDVYVAVGRDDLDVLKWALDHSLSPPARVFLVHVFPSLTYISTPVGKLSRSQLSKEQLRVYINEEHNRRRNLLQKYIRLCNDAKVTVDTVLLESNTTAKAILDLIPVLNITNLVMGTKRPPFPRQLVKKLGTGEFIRKNAPEFCDISIVFEGKKVQDIEQAGGELVHPLPAPSHRKAERNSEWNFFETEVEDFKDSETPAKDEILQFSHKSHLAARRPLFNSFGRDALQDATSFHYVAVLQRLRTQKSMEDMATNSTLVD